VGVRAGPCSTPGTRLSTRNRSIAMDLMGAVARACLLLYQSSSPQTTLLTPSLTHRSLSTHRSLFQGHSAWKCNRVQPHRQARCQGLQHQGVSLTSGPLQLHWPARLLPTAGFGSPTDCTHEQLQALWSHSAEAPCQGAQLEAA
jgi:hypothetical protein